MDGVVGKLKDRISSLETENTLLEKRVSKLESSCDTAEQYSRRNCVRVTGIPETNDESTDDHIMEMANALSLDLTINDVDRSHRVGKKDKPGPRAIIVKFATFRASQKLYRSRTKLKTNGYEGVYVNEDLTQTRFKLLGKARELCKSGKLDSCWSDNGNLLVKDNTSAIHRLSSPADLQNFT